jgi:hypothetical protein
VLSCSDVLLRGLGFDHEDGGIPGSELEWRSDVDGPLGSGTQLRVALASDGEHTITLTGYDSAGGSAEAEVRLVCGGPAFAHRYLIPAVAHAPGAQGTVWRTDVAGIAAGAATGVELTYADGDGTMSWSGSVAAGAAFEWRDVLESLFAMAGSETSSGSLEVLASEAIALSSRTYNQTPDGTFGQYCPAVDLDPVLREGDLGVLAQLRRDASFRTNIGAVNLGDATCTVTVRLYGADGNQVGSDLALSVGAGRWQQQFDVFAAAGAGDVDVAYATTEAGGGCEVWLYASVVDNATGDPTTIPVQ